MEIKIYFEPYKEETYLTLPLLIPCLRYVYSRLAFHFGRQAVNSVHI
jgi:hypothetical protein